MSTKRQDGGHRLLRLEQRGQAVQARVGHGDDAHVRLDGRERIVRRRRVAGGQRVEDGGFADVGQADDADFHDVTSF